MDKEDVISEGDCAIFLRKATLHPRGYLRIL